MELKLAVDKWSVVYLNESLLMSKLFWLRAEWIAKYESCEISDNTESIAEGQFLAIFSVNRNTISFTA